MRTLTLLKVLFISGLIPVLVIGSRPVGAEPTSELPTTEVEQDGERVTVPDFSRITFESLPPIEEDGSIPDFPGLGYSTERSWQAGDKPASFLKLGDFQESFDLQQMNQEEISEESGRDPESVGLDESPLVQDQTMEELVEAVDGLGDRRIEDIPPIRELAEEELGGEWENKTLDQALRDEEFKELKLSDLDNPEDYALDEIPGVSETELENFARWEEAFVEEVPELENVPFSAFPNPPGLGLGVVVAVVDLPLVPEAERVNVISGSIDGALGMGSYENRPCNEEYCPHIEMADPTSGGLSVIHGKQWVSKEQRVPGGFGVCDFGDEPTGNHPFGSHFKVVLTGIDEAAGKVHTALYFRIVCRAPFVGVVGATPYRIGPIPFFTLSEKDLMFVRP